MKSSSSAGRASSTSSNRYSCTLSCAPANAEATSRMSPLVQRRPTRRQAAGQPWVASPRRRTSSGPSSTPSAASSAACSSGVRRRSPRSLPPACPPRAASPRAGAAALGTSRPHARWREGGARKRRDPRTRAAHLEPRGHPQAPKPPARPHRRAPARAARWRDEPRHRPPKRHRAGRKARRAARRHLPALRVSPTRSGTARRHPHPTSTRQRGVPLRRPRRRRPWSCRNRQGPPR